MFMGDAGSIFLGYVFAGLILVTLATGDVTLWAWIAILSYYLADTTTTFLCRLFLVPRWWRSHRSHAYQNLARVTGSHARVTYGVLLFDVCWALPLAIAATLHPRWAPLAAGLALLPAVGWALRYGPLLSPE
jgi:Fuc2NAc and GlcNAc transferase